MSAAGLVPRGLALLVDSSIRTVIYMAAMISLAVWLGDAAVGPIALVIFAVEWFYPVAFEVLWKGQTPGKAALGLRVVHADGTPIRWPASLLRNLLLVADFLPFAYGFGIVSMLCDGSFRRLGDLAAGTLVIHRPEEKPVEWIHGDVKPIPPPIPLDPLAQRAVIAFAERAPSLSPERVEELAGYATPLGGTRQVLDGVAAHLLGREGPVS